MHDMPNLAPVHHSHTAVQHFKDDQAQNPARGCHDIGLVRDKHVCLMCTCISVLFVCLTFVYGMICQQPDLTSTAIVQARCQRVVCFGDCMVSRAASELQTG